MSEWKLVPVALPHRMAEVMRLWLGSDRDFDDLWTGLLAAAPEPPKDELREALTKMADEWAADRPHTYASENSDRYIGWSDATRRCAKQLRALLERYSARADRVRVKE